MENIKILLMAKEATENILRTKGINTTVSLKDFLIDRNYLIFTEDCGIRNQVESINLNELLIEIKTTLIDYTIGVLGTPDMKSEISNIIPNIIINSLTIAQGAKQDLSQIDIIGYVLKYENHHEQEFIKVLSSNNERYAITKKRQQENCYLSSTMNTIKLLEDYKLSIRKQTQNKILKKSPSEKNC